MTFVNIHPAGTAYYPTVQLQWAPTTQPTVGTQTYVDITTRLREWGWSFGRNDELGEFQPGSGYVVLDNRDRALDPSNTAGTWYGNIKPRRAFMLEAQVNGATETIFTAYSRGYPQSWPSSGQDALVRIDLIGRMAFLETFELPVGFSRSAELTGARVGAVLDAIGFSSAAKYRIVDTGTVTMAAFDVTDAGSSALTHIRECAKAEFGEAYDNGERFYFKDRHARLTSAGTFDPFSADFTFTDTAGTTIRYDTTFEPAYDDTYLWNSIVVDGPDPSTDTAGTASGGTTSIADYYSLSKSLSTQLAYEPDRTALAQYYALRYAQPQLRAPALQCEVGAQTTSDNRQRLIAMAIDSQVAIKRFNSGGTVMTLNQYVEGVAQTCRPGGPWWVQIATSPADTNTYWTLQTSTYGTLDSVNVIAP